jgi:hypothetical protein
MNNFDEVIVDLTARMPRRAEFLFGFRSFYSVRLASGQVS